MLVFIFFSLDGKILRQSLLSFGSSHWSRQHGRFWKLLDFHCIFKENSCIILLEWIKISI